MDQPHHHPMRLVRTYDGGGEEWICPECSRRILMQWAPTYRARILAAGDASAFHTGGSAGQRLQPRSGDSVEASASTDAESDSAEALARLADGLRPWQDWLGGLGWSS